jgi:methyl-accepting chemotaxis protein
MKQLMAKLYSRRRHRHSRAQLQSQIDALHKAQAIIEFTLDGKIVAANDNFLAALGYDRDEIIGQHHRMFVEPSQHESDEYKAFWRKLGTGESQSGVYKRVAKGGREVWIQGSYSAIFNALGRPCKVIKHAIDITEERLKTADMEGRLAAIDRAQAVISFDLDGIILDANDNFLAALGYRREDVIGRHHKLFVDPDERESETYRQFWQRLRLGEYNAGLFRRIRRGGASVWIQASYNPIFDMDGRPFKVVKYATDVTEHTRAVQALQSALGSLSDTVPAIAGQAQSANQLAHEASSSASTGGSMVDQLVDTIGHINGRAQSMAEIIGVMDSIAFQTNILAINAAVEAAHAGEQGKGFGVVAQEVRALAQRSSQSAREIRDLVQSAIDSLAEGSQRARQAGEAMHAIVASAAEVNQRVAQIADAAHSQASGIAQVTLAIDQLRQR